MIDWKKVGEELEKNPIQKSKTRILLDEYEKKFGKPYFYQIGISEGTEEELRRYIRTGIPQEIKEYDTDGGRRVF